MRNFSSCFSSGFSSLKNMGLGITVKNNETKDIIKVIKSLGNSAILLKQNLGKSNSQAEGIFNFLAPKMRAVLPLMKILFTLLAKSVMIH